MKPVQARALTRDASHTSNSTGKPSKAFNITECESPQIGRVKRKQAVDLFQRQEGKALQQIALNGTSMDVELFGQLVNIQLLTLVELLKNGGQAPSEKVMLCLTHSFYTKKNTQKKLIEDHGIKNISWLGQVVSHIQIFFQFLMLPKFATVFS